MRCCILVMLLLSPLIVGAQANSEQDLYSEQALREAMALHGLTLSFTEKAINRLGDRAAIGLMRIIADQALTQPNQVKTVLNILHQAFAAPDVIATEADRQPKATLFLLACLQKLPASEGLENDLSEVKSFVSRNIKRR